jgi:hypothetical protein
MATESTTELSIISLASDPFGKCEDWHQSMHQYAANELANRYGLGMMHITATQDEWDNFSINRSTDQEGTVTIAPTSVRANLSHKHLFQKLKSHNHINTISQNG